MANDKGMFTPLGGTQRRPAPPRGEWIVIVPVPFDAPPAPATHPALGAPVLRHVYRNHAGEALGQVLRFNKPDGTKEFLPLTWCRHSDTGETAWRWKSWPAPRPLYGLDRLAARPSAPVIVCEGEKAADAAGRLLPDHVAVTSPHGAKSAGKASWSELRQRRVIIWPDADEAGAGYAEVAARCLSAIGVKAKIIAPPAGVAEGWDAADAEAAGWSTEWAAELVRQARPADGGGEPGEHKDKAGASRRGRRGDGPPQRDIVIDQLGDAELWCDASRESYATVPVDGHMENYAVRSRAFRLWLVGRCFQAFGGVPGGQAFEDALRVIEAMAISGPCYATWRRVGEGPAGHIYIDIGDATWRAVEITPLGWRIVNRADCKFLRSSAMRALPVPEPGETIEELREFINCEVEQDFMLAVAWLVAALRPRGPYPVAAINGEQGSAKTSTSRVLRGLIDPNASPLRAVPRDDRDLLVAAENAWAVAYDNISGIAPWLSDALCRLATGGGFGTRELHTDRGEIVFEATRPILLNGISDIAGRPDLQDRALVLALPTIPEDKRRSERAFWRAFEAKAPGIMGALCDAVARALRDLGDVKLDRLPRMADFVQWIEAAAPALGWERGEFLRVYADNRASAHEVALEASAVAGAIRDFVLSMPGAEWEGTSTELLAKLNGDASDATRAARYWPKTASELGAHLARVAPVLRANGIAIQRTRDGKDRRKTIHLKRAAK